MLNLRFPIAFHADDLSPHTPVLLLPQSMQSNAIPRFAANTAPAGGSSVS